MKTKAVTVDLVRVTPTLQSAVRMAALGFVKKESVMSVKDVKSHLQSGELIYHIFVGKSEAGFAINIKPCKIHTKAFYKHPSRGKLPGDFCYFDYIVLVTLSKDLELSKFYIFPKEFLIKNELNIRNRSARFNRGTHMEKTRNSN
jgi:hypothetical protein